MTGPTPPTLPYDDGTPASPDQVAALWQQLREFSDQIARDRRRMRDNEVARLTALHDAETDESVRAEIRVALDRVLADAPEPDEPVPSHT